MSELEEPGYSAKSGLNIRWSSLTLSLAIFASACLGTLVVVASVQKADALSTVALALAVLAFAAQLIVSMLQSSAGAQQLVQTERVNSSTQAALADIRATSNSVLSNQRDLFGEVLRAALKEKVPSVAREVAEDSAEDPTNEGLISEELEEKLTRAIDRTFSQISRRNQSVEPHEPRKRSAHPMYGILRTYPGEVEGRMAVELLRRLTQLEAMRVGDFARRFHDLARQGLAPRTSLIRSADQPLPGSLLSLAEKGVVVVSEGSHLADSVRYNIRFTDLGNDIARFVTAVGPPPEWLTGLLMENGESGK
ncbi:hypothetical protein H4W30_008352 [Amycolatopsis roodepoortensis]|uniref:Uncharacterized protein n=1 Tax=Amycolatopsis roodepoortensis TaxID=700274 RepID=A0ABR9LKR6_9PSEU|nr:hypothetical protein [Amycolatopsis roodepoortensis]